jgi:uncharacterized protein (DUF2141 family)
MIRFLILAVVLAMATPNIVRAGAQKLPATSAPTTEQVVLTVTVTNLRNSNGQVLITLWNSPDGFPTKGDKGFKMVAVDARKSVNGAVTIAFTVAPGTYAISTMHDENSNNKMDFNLIGIPKEGYGTSSPSTSHFHIPSFDEAKFQVPTPTRNVSVRMRY